MSRGHNFVALHMTANTGATIVAQAIPSQGSPTVPFNDDDVVLQINSNTTGIKATVTEGDISEEFTFDISGLTQESE